MEIIKPSDLSNTFKNINHKPCKVPGYDLAWDVNENGLFKGELFYSKEFNQWHFILDNFPHPRRSFKTSFPQTEKSFISMFKRIKISLTKNKNN